MLFAAGSACHWNVWFTAALVALLNEEPTKSRGRDALPAVAVATPVAGKISLPRTSMAVIPVCAKIEF